MKVLLPLTAEQIEIINNSYPLNNGIMLGNILANTKAYVPTKKEIDLLNRMTPCFKFFNVGDILNNDCENGYTQSKIDQLNKMCPAFFHYDVGLRILEICVSSAGQDSTGLTWDSDIDGDLDRPLDGPTLASFVPVADDDGKLLFQFTGQSYRFDSGADTAIGNDVAWPDAIASGTLSGPLRVITNDGEGIQRWDTFASNTNDGVQTLTFDKSDLSSGDDGGSIQYYYDAAAWENAIGGTYTRLEIDIDGNVYVQGHNRDPKSLVVDINGNVGPAGEAAQQIAYTDPDEDGIERHLVAPSDLYATAPNFLPVKTAASPGISLSIGDNTWLPDTLNVGELNTWIGQGAGQGAEGSHGEIKFSPVGGDGKWSGSDFAGAGELEGLHTFSLPRTGNFTNTGGQFIYYYHRAGWTNAFEANTSEIIIAQDGSVYRDSISVANLVVDGEGTLGLAGGALP